MKGSPPKTVNMAPPGDLFGSQQCGDDDVESPANSLLGRFERPKYRYFEWP